MKFKKKPVVIEAVQWLKPGDHPLVREGKNPDAHPGTESVGFYLKTGNGWVKIEPGDWILTDPISADTWPVKAQIFEATYEKVETKKGGKS